VSVLVLPEKMIGGLDGMNRWKQILISPSANANFVLRIYLKSIQLASFEEEFRLCADDGFVNFKGRSITAVQDQV
jgi:hypothetical protein